MDAGTNRRRSSEEVAAEARLSCEGMRLVADEKRDENE